MFEAYITNTALYPLMGIEVGTTVHFPMTTQELQAALAKIGIDGKRYSEVFFTSFDSDVLGLYDHLYECVFSNRSYTCGYLCSICSKLSASYNLNTSSDSKICVSLRKLEQRYISGATFWLS